MRPEPPHHENAELAEMNVEMIDTPQPADIDDLRQEIDRLDAEILAAVKRRTEASPAIGKARMASGGTRLVHSREMKVIERYSELGPDGKDLAMLLLRLGRGRLGHGRENGRNRARRSAQRVGQPRRQPLDRLRRRMHPVDAHLYAVDPAGVVAVRAQLVVEVEQGDVGSLSDN